MKKVNVFFAVIIALHCVVFSGCGAKKATSSKEAISISGTMQTVEDKVNYLVSQAQAFYDSKDFQNAIDIAQYILASLDKDSQKARDLLTQAKSQLQDLVEKKGNELKQKLGSFGK